MTASHAHFGALCALAASGQLTPTELGELHEHATDCASCRKRIAELNEVGAYLFLGGASAHSGRRAPKGMTDRFVTRAISEGVPLTIRSSSIEVRRLGVAAVVILGVLIIAAVHRKDASPGTPRDVETASVVGTRSNPPFRGEPAEAAVGAASPAAHQIASRRYLQRKGRMRDYSIATAMLFPDSRGSSPPSFRPPTFRLNSGTKKDNSPGLLADCDDCAFIASAGRPGFAFAPFTYELHHGLFDPEAYHAKPDFRLDPTALHLIQNVVIHSDQKK